MQQTEAITYLTSNFQEAIIKKNGVKLYDLKTRIKQSLNLTEADARKLIL